MVVAFLAQPAGRSHSLYTHLPLFRSHSPPQRCPSSSTRRDPLGRLRTAPRMPSLACTLPSPFSPPGGNTLFIHTFHSLDHIPHHSAALHHRDQGFFVVSAGRSHSLYSILLFLNYSTITLHTQLHPLCVIPM